MTPLSGPPTLGDGDRPEAGGGGCSRGGFAQRAEPGCGGVIEGHDGLQLRVRLDEKLLGLADGGDLQAIQMLSERVAGVALGRVERCRTAKSMQRRVLRALADGQLSVSEAARLAGLVKLKQELERDNAKPG